MKESQKKLTEEQMKKLEALEKKLTKRVLLAIAGYGMWLVFANLFLVIMSVLYVEEKGFLFFTSLGTAVILCSGLSGTLEEIKKDTDEEIKKILHND